MPSTRSAPAPQIRAAGAICWRLAPGLPPGTPPTASTMQLLMVRSARWGHWSWPKGKLEPGEPAAVAAVREVAEETGVRPRLGLPLPSLRYVINDGRSKQVDFWAGRVDPDRTAAATAGSDEIAEVAWASPQDAIGRLEWPAEAAPAEHLLRIAGVDRLDTRALLFVRHAKARKRSTWRGGEEDRPLTTTGHFQSDGLIWLLDCWGPARLVTSPWLRCRDTVQPYADGPGPALELEPVLSERGALHDPELLAKQIQALVADGQDAAVCTHRPVLADVVRSLHASTRSARAAGGLPRSDPWLRTAEVLVAHLRPGGGEVLAVERHRPSRTPVHLRST